MYFIKPNNNLIKNNYEIFIFIALGIITFYLSINFSKDWLNYVFIYENKISNVAWQSFLNQFSVFKEPLFFISSKAAGQLVGFSIFVFLATVILLTIKLRYLSKIMQDPFLGTFFYVCFYLLLLEGTAIRVGYAIAFIIPALYFLREHKFLYAFLLILVASQIHLTALIFLIVFPLYFFKSLNIFVYLAFIFSPLLIIFDISVLKMFKELIVTINPKYLHYFGEKKLLVQNSTGLYLYFIAFFSMLLSAVFFYMKELVLNDRFISSVFSITLCGIVSMCVFHDFVAIGARFGELLLVPIVILLGHLYKTFSLNKMLVHRFILISLSLGYLAARFVYLYPKSIEI